ncbi:MAG: PorP/SprF family type IX secretion system membrane protein [Bacteroidota bacterium]
MNTNFTSYIFGLFFLCLASTLSAQDSRFAQFYASPLQLNPAMTGVFEGSWRLHANYRDQWSSILGNQPFRTFAAGFDARYNVVEDDYLAVGFSGLRDDRQGDALFSQQRGHLNFAYLKNMGGNAYGSYDQYIIIGSQIGLGQHAIDADPLWFSTQFDATAGNPNFGLDNAENGIGSQQLKTNLYVDFNAGLMWYALLGDRMSVYAGGALYHLNNPDISFLDGQSESLYRRWTTHAGAELPLTDEMSLMPAFVLSGQGPSRSTTFGTNVRYTNHDWYELAVRVGAWWHLSKRVEPDAKMATDALTIAAILEMERWNLGISYDINTSNLTAATNARGAFELSLIYTHPAQQRERINCPNF